VDVEAELHVQRADREPLDVVLVVPAAADEAPYHAERQEQADAEREDPVNRPLAGRALAEEQRQGARQERQQRDDVGVMDEPVRPGDRGRPPPLRQQRAYHLRRSTSSTLIVARLRNSKITIASPMPTSAAATAITNNANTWPVMSCSW